MNDYLANSTPHFDNNKIENTIQGSKSAIVGLKTKISELQDIISRLDAKKQSALLRQKTIELQNRSTELANAEKLLEKQQALTIQTLSILIPSLIERINSNQDKKREALLVNIPKNAKAISNIATLMVNGQVSVDSLTATLGVSVSEELADVLNQALGFFDGTVRDLDLRIQNKESTREIRTNKKAEMNELALSQNKEYIASIVLGMTERFDHILDARKQKHEFNQAKISATQERDRLLAQANKEKEQALNQAKRGVQDDKSRRKAEEIIKKANLKAAKISAEYDAKVRKIDINDLTSEVEVDGNILIPMSQDHKDLMEKPFFTNIDNKPNSQSGYEYPIDNFPQTPTIMNLPNVSKNFEALNSQIEAAQLAVGMYFNNTDILVKKENFEISALGATKAILHLKKLLKIRSEMIMILTGSKKTIDRNDYGGKQGVNRSGNSPEDKLKAANIRLKNNQIESNNPSYTTLLFNPQDPLKYNQFNFSPTFNGLDDLNSESTKLNTLVLEYNNKKNKLKVDKKGIEALEVQVKNLGEIKYTNDLKILLTNPNFGVDINMVSNLFDQINNIQIGLSQFQNATSMPKATKTEKPDERLLKLRTKFTNAKDSFPYDSRDEMYDERAQLVENLYQLYHQAIDNLLKSVEM
jgi:hypothetical protein